MRNLTTEPKGKFPLAAAHAKSVSHFDMLYYKDVIERVQRQGSVSDLDLCVYHFGPVIWEAVRNPGQRISRYFEENCLEYEWSATFNPATFVVETNYIVCPNRDHHHLGKVCPVCNVNG